MELHSFPSLLSELDEKMTFISNVFTVNGEHFPAASCLDIKNLLSWTSGRIYFKREFARIRVSEVNLPSL